MSVTDGAVLAATIGGPTVAALAIWVGYLNSQGERRNARDLLRSERWFGTRREVYEGTLRYMHRAMRQADQDQGALGNPPGEPVTPDEEMKFQVQSYIFGSEQVTNAAEEFFAAVRGFAFYSAVQRSGEAAGRNALESFQEASRFRDQASDLLKNVETLMREELEKL